MAIEGIGSRPATAGASIGSATGGGDASPARHDTPATGAREPSAFARVLHGLGREVARGESVMNGALGAQLSGRDLSSSEMLSLQAGVYRYGEVVDLASRLVDRATGGVKTVLQGGGQ